MSKKEMICKYCKTKIKKYPCRYCGKGIKDTYSYPKKSENLTRPKKISVRLFCREFKVNKYDDCVFFTNDECELFFYNNECYTTLRYNIITRRFYCPHIEVIEKAIQKENIHKEIWEKWYQNII